MNNINSEYPEYDYQKFDYLFKVIGNEDILINQNDNKYLPFISCLQININSQKYFNQFIQQKIFILMIIFNSF